ncbi:MAG: response regulator [Bacteroidota bacterium]
MKKISSYIIDDEKPARDLLKVYLDELSNIEIIGEAENGFEGAKLVNEHKPDLIFLDIQMPKINGFEMLELLDYEPKVIFCTAYDKYAIQAFEKNAVDYLLKPFPKERLLDALNKVAVVETGSSSVKSILKEYPDILGRIVVKDRKEIVIIDVNEINFIEAQDDYVAINTSKGKWLKQKTMKYYEEALDPTKFVRVHRSYILNLLEIAKIDKMGKETYVSVLKSGKNIPVSTTGYQKLKMHLGL